MTTLINKDNFFKNTFGIFKMANKPYREPNYVSFKKARLYPKSMPYEGITEYEGKTFDDLASEADKEKGYVCIETKEVSSSYWYTELGVYRESNHWGKVSGCYWASYNQKFFKKIYDENDDFVSYETSIGFCKWSDFKNIKYYDIDNGDDVSFLNNSLGVAVEFGRLQVATNISYNERKLFIQHPNHFVRGVNIIEGLNWSNKIQKLKDMASFQTLQSKC